MFDEVSFQLCPELKRVWAQKGSKPEGLFFWSNKKLHLTGALIDGKELYYEWYDRLNSTSFIAYMKRFIDYLPKDKKYLFIFDNAPAHKSKMSKDFLKSLEKRFAIEFLPPYSPQLNAIESCWKIIKSEVTYSNIFKSLEDLKKGVEEFLKGYFFRFNLTNYLIL